MWACVVKFGVAAGWAKFPILGPESHILCCEFCCWSFAQILEVTRGQDWKRCNKMCVEKNAPEII